MYFLSRILLALVANTPLVGGQMIPAQMAPQVAAFAGLAPGQVVYWAGHEVINGTKQIPVIGKLKTRTETYSIARVTSDPAVPGGLILDANACRVSFKKVAGIGVSMDATKLPASQVRLKPEGAGLKGGGRIRWGREDVDKDGRPGAAVSVDSTMCGGTLHVSNDSRISMSSDGASSAGMTGRVNVRVSQSILEAEGRCLSRMAKDESASSSGRFAYTQVPAGSSCASLMRGGWPVRAN
jgi:hypothetical protein